MDGEDYNDAKRQHGWLQGALDGAEERLRTVCASKETHVHRLVLHRFHPSAIVFPTSEEQIEALVKRAKQCDYRVAVRSGGHNYQDFSSCNDDEGPCVQISMDHFDHITPTVGEDGTHRVIVGSGTQLEDLNPALAALGEFSGLSFLVPCATQSP